MAGSLITTLDGIRILHMKKTLKVITTIGLLVASVSSSAGDEAAKTAAPMAKIQASIEAGLQVGKPGLAVTSVETSVIPGLYKATVGQGPHIYVTEDGKYFISGDIFSVEPGKIVNLTDTERNGDRAKAMASIEKKDMIIFPPKGDAKKVMYVFTDVDCGYCQLLHSKVPEYNDLGIEVRYLAYPRAGINSQSYNKIASAWCAKDRNAALTKLKNREEIPNNVCEGNPVANQYDIGRQIGLTGTPAIILEDGELIAGYVEPAKIKGMLGL